MNLLTKVPEEAVAFLERSVKVRGMNRYFSNEVIGRDLLNLNYSSASGVTEAWKDQLRNTSDNKLVPCSKNMSIFKSYCFMRSNINKTGTCIRIKSI